MGKVTALHSKYVMLPMLPVVHALHKQKSACAKLFRFPIFFENIAYNLIHPFFHFSYT